jgi:RNA polymerase sigma-70 factor (ECF subfamily)
MAETTTHFIQGCLARLRAGDAAARAELLRHAAARLEHLARKMLSRFQGLRGLEQTEDVLQGALLRLWKSLEAVPVETVRGFFGLAAAQIRRELLDLARRHYGRGGDRPTVQPLATESSGQSPLDPADAAQPPPDDLACWSEFHARVGALPDDERETVELLWYQGLPQPEAAALLGVSLATVKRAWLSARLKLQDCFPGEAPETNNS